MLAGIKTSLSAVAIAVIQRLNQSLKTACGIVIDFLIVDISVVILLFRNQVEHNVV